MSDLALPANFRLESLSRSHPRRGFDCGNDLVDSWLRTKALQHQEKHLSATRVLISGDETIAGFYTLATGQVDFGDLPAELSRRLPRRALPVAVLAWLGVSGSSQGQGIGRLLLAQALRDCYEASRTFAFVAVILDSVDDHARAFYQHWDFETLPGHPYRMFLSAERLALMMSHTEL